MIVMERPTDRDPANALPNGSSDGPKRNESARRAPVNRKVERRSAELLYNARYTLKKTVRRTVPRPSGRRPGEVLGFKQQETVRQGRNASSGQE